MLFSWSSFLIVLIFIFFLVTPLSVLDASLLKCDQTYFQSACWAMAKSWLDVQVDLELAHLEPGRLDQFKRIGDAIDGSPGHSDEAVQPSNGPAIWPLQVLNQQPRQLSDLLQKLHSG